MARDPLAGASEVDALCRRYQACDAFVRLIENVRRGALLVEDLLVEDYARVSELLMTYRDLRVGFVDPAVLAIVERLGERKLATLDHRTSLPFDRVTYRRSSSFPETRLPGSGIRSGRIPPVRVGIDLIEIARIERALARPRFRERVFTDAERAYCDSRAHPAQHYAARFAGKEAVGKALGCGVNFSWREIEIAGRPKPDVRLSGRTKAWAAQVRAGQIDLSMTHSKELAAAVCTVLDMDGLESL